MFFKGFWYFLAVSYLTVESFEIDYRLPTTVSPLHYNLILHPDLKTGILTGQEVIKIRTNEATKQIILHSYDLNITSVNVLGAGDAVVGQYKLDEVRDFLIIDLTEELSVNSIFSLAILFEGQIQNKLFGMYSSSYQNPEGELRKLVTTQFEPIYAREAFPCFDEPAMKASFDISVIHDSDSSYNAISNMNKIKSIPDGENTMSIFATSVPMSTYLVCVIVADFDSQAGEVNARGIGNNFTVNAYVAPHQLHKVKFALDFGIAVTEYYIQYFKIPYPLPKMDMAAIPDFSNGAMENWGLITYREADLLYDMSYSSTENKQRIAETVAHEISHQWFGNLVTMKWWSDIWLNEGFAQYMQYKGVNAIYSDWGMLEQFQIMNLQTVLKLDGKLSSHSIVQKVQSPDEIIPIFDPITYKKGSSILRMLESLVGEETFQQAVTNYLTKYQYQNTETDDFLSEVAALVTDFDVKLLMRTWTEQMGYPVLNVQRFSDTGFTITQQRFFSNKDSYEEVAETSVFDYKWSVPVTYMLDTYDPEEVGKVIFNYNEDTLGVAVSSDVKWIKLNVHQVGYYRVNYESSIWEQIIQQLISDPSRFDIADRAHLLNDAFALAEASQLSYTVPLEMTAYLAQEKNFVPWYVAAGKLKSLKNSLMLTDSYVLFVNYTQTILINVYNEMGWNVDADNHLKNLLRASIINLACAFGLPDCLNEAADRFSTWLKNPSNRPAPDLREVVYFYGMQQTNSESNWEQLLELFKAESHSSEKLKLMYGLSGVQDAQLLYRFLELATDESIVRSQDYFTCLDNIAANPVGEPVIWEYYREQWPQLVTRFGLNDEALGKLIASITGRFDSQIKLEEVQDFFTKFPDAGAGALPRKQAIETIRYNIIWLQENSADIASWLQDASTRKFK